MTCTAPVAPDRVKTASQVFAKLLMKQEQWRLFTCSNDPHDKIGDVLQHLYLICFSFQMFREKHSHCNCRRHQKIHNHHQTAQALTRPALAHKVEERPPKSPLAMSQLEITATHHGFALPQPGLTQSQRRETGVFCSLFFSCVPNKLVSQTVTAYNDCILQLLYMYTVEPFR